MCAINAGKINFADDDKLKELGVTHETIASTGDTAFVRTNFNAKSSSKTDEDKDEGKKSPLPSENYGSDMRMNSLNMTLKPAFDNFSQHRA